MQIPILVMQIPTPHAVRETPRRWTGYCCDCVVFISFIFFLSHYSVFFLSFFNLLFRKKKKIWTKKRNALKKRKYSARYGEILHRLLLDSDRKCRELVVSSKDRVLGFLFPFFVMLERESRALRTLSKFSATESHTHPEVLVFWDSISVQQAGFDFIL